MSIRLNEKVTCPKCSFVYERECCPSVNVATDPELREEVATGNLCVAICPSCGVTTRLIYPCLYVDPKQDLAVYFLPRAENRSIPAAEMQALMQDATAKTLRLVDDFAELMEKVAIFENGLNDRVMELFKAYTALTLMSAPGDGFKPDTLIFQGKNDSGQFLMRGVRDGESRQLSVPQQLYAALEEATKEREWEAEGAFEMVDMIWALDLLKEEGSILDNRGAFAPKGELQ